MSSRNNSISSVRSASGAKAWIVNHIKEHHRSVNAAYSAMYGNVTTPSSSTSSTPAVSRKGSAAGASPVTEAAPAAPVPFVHAAGNERPSYFDRAIAAAKKHHKETTAAHRAYYGMGVHC